jgi:hypothetical protein
MPEGASWNAEKSIFRWSSGEVTLPPGLTYSRIDSDTFEGNFVSKSGRIAIHHDIGTKAGAWAQRLNSVRFRDTIISGARVWFSERLRGGEGDPEILIAVTFPDNECANFFMVTKDAPNHELMDAIARTFKPANTIPATGGLCEQRER